MKPTVQEEMAPDHQSGSQDSGRTASDTAGFASGNGNGQGKARIVLFVTHTPGYGGTEKHLIELLARMGDSGVRPLILCAESDPYTERLNSAHISTAGVRSESLRSVGDWYRLFKDIKPDVVVFVYGEFKQLPWYASVAGKLAGVKKLYAIQHLIAPPVPPQIEGYSFQQIVRRFVGRRVRTLLSVRVPPHLCKKTICVSNAVRNALVRNYRFPQKKTITIHNGVSVSEFTPSANDGTGIRTELGLRTDDFVLVCVARLGEEKGIDILLLAVRELLNRNLSCKCIIVGEGYFRDNLMEQVRTLELTQNVFMVGFYQDVRPFLHASDLFVLTSHIEGLPFAVLEAMACGLPCVVTNVGGNAEAVASNVNGLVVNPGSPGEVVEAISYLMKHPQERDKMSLMARSRACQEFDIEARMADIKRAILN